MLRELLSKFHLDQYELTSVSYQREDDELIYILQVPADQWYTVWKQLHKIVNQSGYWPVGGWDSFKKPPWEEEKTINILERANQINIHDWFIRESENSETFLTDGDISPPLKKYNLNRITHGASFPNTPFSFVPIALVPTIHFWEIPAYLRLPEDSQLPEVHVAALKYWNSIYQSELVFMNSGVMFLHVMNPPTTYTNSLRLAQEQYCYCPDIVDQEFRTTANLAKQLMNQRVWRFWWD
jgi:Domain of unknown function (DUF4253)